MTNISDSMMIVAIGAFQRPSPTFVVSLVVIGRSGRWVMKSSMKWLKTRPATTSAARAVPPRIVR